MAVECLLSGAVIEVIDRQRGDLDLVPAENATYALSREVHSTMGKVILRGGLGCFRRGISTTIGPTHFSMNFKTISLALLAFICATRLPAAGALYTVRLAGDRSFELVAEPNAIHQLSFSPLGEIGTKIMAGPGKRKLVAADYEPAFVKIRTQDPVAAAQEILRQISQQTGLMLRVHLNSSLAQIAPVTVVQAISDTAVITLILTPVSNDVFLVTCAYVLDERPSDSVDGTPASIVQMDKTAATLRAMEGDSQATHLPERVVMKDLKAEAFFRGTMMRFDAVDAEGKTFETVALMLRKGSDYTVGFYRNEDGILALLDRPLELLGTKSPYLTNLPEHTSIRTDRFRMALRANKPTGTGGYYLALELGHPVKIEF